MSFDVLAPHYLWMERVFVGNQLQLCRIEFLGKIRRAKNILILGEGNGRFLLECRRSNSTAHITCLDASPRMLSLAQARLRRGGITAENISFVCGDALQWTPPENYDAVVTHFFLDCFQADQLPALIAKLGSAAAQNAIWLIADFRTPAMGFSRWRARLVLRSLYIFFRICTRISARELTTPDTLLEQVGFRLGERRMWNWDLLHSDWWERSDDGRLT